MARHHDEMMRQLGAGRIQWTAPLAALADLGLTDEHGRPLTRDTASRTWRRVRETVAAARQAEARALPASGELVPGVRLVSHARTAMPVRSSPAPVALATAPIAGAPTGAVEATERISAVLAAMGASRVPLPPLPSRQPQPVPGRPPSDEESSS